jgi:hypothetical protein
MNGKRPAEATTAPARKTQKQEDSGIKELVNIAKEN